MICLCRLQTVTVSTCDKSQITVAINDGSLKYPAWLWGSQTHVWIEQSRISPLQIIKDDNLFEKFHTVIYETGPTPFTFFFFSFSSIPVLILSHQLCQSVSDLHSQNQIRCKFVPKWRKKAIRLSSSIWRAEFFASLFLVLN